MKTSIVDPTGFILEGVILESYTNLNLSTVKGGGSHKHHHQQQQPPPSLSPSAASASALTHQQQHHSSNNPLAASITSTALNPQTRVSSAPSQNPLPQQRASPGSESGSLRHHGSPALSGKAVSFAALCDSPDGNQKASSPMGSPGDAQLPKDSQQTEEEEPAAPKASFLVKYSFAHPITGRICSVTEKVHQHRVIPFGYIAPSKLFAKPGRHCEQGIIQEMTAEGAYLVSPFVPSSLSKPSSPFKETLVLGQMALAPALGNPIADPRPPYKVGTEVRARRFGFDGLHTAVVVSVNLDITYTLQYWEDGHQEDGVLHRDILPPGAAPPTAAVAASSAGGGKEQQDGLMDSSSQLSESFSSRRRNDSFFADDENDADAPQIRLSARDRIIVGINGPKFGTVIQVVSPFKARVVLHDTGEVVTIPREVVLAQKPHIKQALGAERHIFKLFNAIDHACLSQVPWRQAKEALIGELEVRSGVTVSQQQLLRAFSEWSVFSGRSRRSSASVVVEQLDELLTFVDFDFIYRRLTNIST